jgi:hypothetical protein
MKPLSLKKITTAVLLSTVVVGCAFAATPAAPPKEASAKIQQPAPTYPGAAWSYAVPPLNSSTLPTIDKNAQLFLPYLPWIGQNIALLVNYADFFYQLQQADINGSTGPYNSVATATTNNVLSQTRTQNMEIAGEKTASEISAQLNFDPAAFIWSAKLASIPGTDSVAPCTGTNCPSKPSNSEFNADVLFGSTSYTSDQVKSIDALIYFLSNLTQPLPNPGLSSDEATRKAELQRADVQSYLLMVRTLVSLQSMALSNFNN